MADNTTAFCFENLPRNQQLRLIYDLLKGAAAGTNGQTTPSATAATSSGSVAAGARSVTFVSSSDFAGTILGVAFPASSTLTLTAPAGLTLGAIAYTRSAGTLYIYEQT